MFCSLILRIRSQYVITLKSFHLDALRSQERTPHCTLLTANIKSIAIGNSKNPDGLFLTCRCEQM